MYNKFNALESSGNRSSPSPPPPPVENLSSMKPVPGARNVGHHFSRGVLGSTQISGRHLALSLYEGWRITWGSYRRGGGADSGNDFPLGWSVDWSSSPVLRPCSFLVCSLPFLLPLHFLSPESTPKNHVNKYPHVRLCFWGTWSKTQSLKVVMKICTDLERYSQYMPNEQLKKRKSPEEQMSSHILYMN